MLSFLAMAVGISVMQPVHAKEIVATTEWQVLADGDTIPAGLHVRIDLSTGEKLVKIPTDDSRDDSIKAAIYGD
ncbi:hypothetical protein THAOC_06257 [Thalassiosira oceanica]|uniref:Uncharacterized protein n=1 Tax=Thalassiosira oceanica TaxID=159749 RepID=K0TLX2_THAOC|nr:hypothetical protein THAOC_06257 [Thalassiosira oceanica]|eukprot:EJK72227.1 hypothetical protein THAOC_06257 [Thalassiosira oceanica]